MIGTVKAKYMTNKQIIAEKEKDLIILQQQVVELEELLFIHTKLAMLDNSVERKDNLAQLQEDLLHLHILINTWATELTHIYTLENNGK